MEWKHRLAKKPSNRYKVYSTKLNKWYDSEEEAAMLEMLWDKRQALMNKLKQTDNTLTDEQAQGLAEQMLSNPEAAKKILEDFEDEPEAKSE